MTGPVVAVVTLVHGRHDHLRAQARSLADGTKRPDLWVVMAMDDEEILAVLRPEHVRTPVAASIHVGHVERSEGGQLPLAAARNAAAVLAVNRGADVLIFLDVDCLVSTTLVEAYTDACQRLRTRGFGDGGPAVVCGAAHYLPPLPAGQQFYEAADLRSSHAHPIRPVARASGELLREADLMLFWSLSFATSASDWLVVGGFDTAYVGYGGEDTDFAKRLGRLGGRLYWLGGAVAYHQYHEIEDPPRAHLVDIVRNANLFHERWGEFPMRGWLDAFEADGLIRLSGRPPRWRLTKAAGMPSHTP